MTTWIVYLIEGSIAKIECQKLVASMPNCYDFMNDTTVIASIPSSSVLMIVPEIHTKIVKLERDLF